MSFLLVRHQVQDYAKWKPIFDAHAATRKANGSKGGQLFRSADNPNEVVILLEWDDVKRARQFAQSVDLRETMQRAGVTDKPDVFFFEGGEKVTV